MRNILLLIAIMIATASCTVQQPLYNYTGYDDAIYQYTKNKDDKSLDQLLKVYDELITKTGSRQVPPPGLYADYGFLLIQKGELIKGKELLKMEASLYPESSYFVGLILKRIEQ